MGESAVAGVEIGCGGEGLMLFAPLHGVLQCTADPAQLLVGVAKRVLAYIAADSEGAPA